MIDPHTYALFVATAAILVLSPGPDMALILSRTLAAGPTAGLMTLLGTQVGNIVHAMLAGIGVSTIVLLFPVLFNLLKVAGVAYLLYLAVAAWRASTLRLEGHFQGRGHRGRHFIQGLANNLANPKMIVFFLALFPQFVRPDSGSLAVQSFILGTTLAVMAVAWMGFIVIAVGRFRTAVATSPTFLKLANRLACVTFVGLACRLAVQDSH